MNERQEGLGEFVVARGDASEMLETCEETLDQIAGAVEMSIEFARQVSPRAACAQNPEDCLDEDTVISRGTAWIAGLAWQEVFNTRPLVISRHLPVHPDSAEKSGYDHIQTVVNSPWLCH